MTIKAKDAMETLAAFQEETGKTAHELVQVILRLYQLAARVQRYNELDCNHGLDPRQQRVSDRLEKAMVELAASIGLVGKHGGDPRGYPFYVLLPKTRRYNSWGGAETGWGIG